MPLPNLEHSVEEVGSWVSQLPIATRPLSKTELSRFEDEAQIVAGWCVSAQLTEETNIGILIPMSFPFTPPEFAVLGDRSENWPHCKEDGRLCAYPETTEVSAYRPVEVVAELFKDVLGLVQSLLNNELANDFGDEFETYWLNKSSPNFTINYSLLVPETAAGLIKIWLGRAFHLIASTEQELTDWLTNHGVKPESQIFHDAFLCNTPTPLLPRDYPKSCGAVLTLIETHSPNHLGEFRQLIAGDESHLSVVIASETSSGPCFAAVQILRSVATFNRGRKSQVQIPGFRPGKAPAILEANHRLSNSVVRREPVRRADGPWVHGRGKDDRYSILKKQNVCVIGNGSVGSYVASNLAEVGVGGLVLVDPGLLEWENTGRHYLGGDDVRNFKSVALAKRISRRFPNIAKSKGYQKKWQDVFHSGHEQFNDFDLVVSLTGSWSSDLQLNSELLGIDVPILYGWLEPFAAAGHSLLLNPKDACIQCGFDDMGQPIRRVFDWNGKETLAKQGGCGTLFQPYGPADCLHSIAMMTETAIDSLMGRIKRSSHRVWINKELPDLDLKPQWSLEWKKIENFDSRQRVIELPWNLDKECQLCARPIH